MFFSDDDNTLHPTFHRDEIIGMFRLFSRICDVMLFVVDETGCIRMVNEHALTRLGYGEKDLLGQSFLRLFDEENTAEMQERLCSIGSDVQHVDTIPYLGREKRTVAVETRMIRGTVRGKNFIFIISKDISRIRATEDKFFKAFHSSSVIMVVFTVDEGRIIDANETAFKMTGYSANEMIGRTIVDLNLYPERAQRKKVQQLIREKGRIEDYELTVRNKAGETRYVIFSMDALTIDDEPCVLAVGSDFTERKLAEQELKQAYMEQMRQKEIIEKKSRELERAKKTIENEVRLVEESSRHKSEFLACMSHELRTPLNSIILLSDLLARNSEGRLTEKEAEYAGIIKSAGRDLLELINDLLDISRVESGRMEVNLSRVSMEYFCRKIRGYFMEMAEVKGLIFEIDAQAGLTEYFVTDVQKLEQIVRNLVSNAIKFTEKGYVRLRIHRPDPSQDLSMIGLGGLCPDRTLAFSVDDTGIGIHEEKHAYIFEQYRQADQSIVQKYGGTGLGLPVSRVLAQLLGGDILVESALGRGSTFTLYIPEQSFWISQPDPKTIPRTPMHPVALKPELGRCLAGKTVIIADDDMRTIYSLIQNFEIYRPEIIVAGDGKKCMDKLKENPHTDLLLLDIAMPEVDGLSVLRTIRKNQELNKLPVIIISARSMEQDGETFLEEGANAFLSKPLDVEKLLITISSVLSEG